ncbi:putative bifunctional inhibitor/plant lipid transfer protein/seed storage helical [Rosa chinensis]|uniref:Putative bifunctional inhibitor/plant lipid transfer protein/seed storage helical n=1 Tax=Rosa chinensis TaxID=74649 RepID=A0A2P6PXQ9_ROSCH|nr:14 kDa proline-rich protein DC2.15 [Rosa chinensis]PRQ26717.1 putative bifunctional inhibitor/plant lipid transfer protein/seed storage helical [Rosa chinensis]
MASSTNLSATLLVFSVLLYSSTFSSACGTCNPAPKTPKPPKPAPTPITPVPTTPAPAMETCPRDTLKLGVCADLLGLVNVQIGSPVTSPCCALLEGLADLEAALCLCIALKANVLGINLDVPIALNLLVSACQKTVPPGFKCK